MIKPDLIFACYGMNDGIYHPYSRARFSDYVRRMDKLIEAVNAAGTPLVLMTPSPPDPEPVEPKES
jgi:lysophospholipase L1-like esterase